MDIHNCWHSNDKNPCDFCPLDKDLWLLESKAWKEWRTKCPHKAPGRGRGVHSTLPKVYVIHDSMPLGHKEKAIHFHWSDLIFWPQIQILCLEHWNSLTSENTPTEDASYFHRVYSASSGPAPGFTSLISPGKNKHTPLPGGNDLIVRAWKKIIIIN